MTQGERLRALRQHRARLQRQIEQRQQRSLRFSWARLLLFALGVAGSAALLFLVGQLAFWLALAAVVLFFGVVVQLHQRVETSLQRFIGLRQFVDEQIARLELAWERIPAARLRDLRYEHPYEVDLDLVGERSLHRLLDTSAALASSARLRDWLTLVAPNLAQTQARQQAVRELSLLTSLRHRLAVDGRLLVATEQGWDATRLLGWLAQREDPARIQRWLIGLSIFAGVNWLLLLGDWQGWAAPWWRWSLILYTALYMVQATTIGATFHEAAALRDELQRLQGVLRHLERFHFVHMPSLRQRCVPLQEPLNRPSQRLRRLGRIIAATGLQANPLIGLALNLAAPWGLFFALQLNRQKVQLAADLPAWLEIWYEVEALSALANAAYLHPQASFPQLREAQDAPVFRVAGLGHPLLPEAGKVRNDFQFTDLGELVILTGSNMAGKSTFLKALGVNLALAQAGGVVDATCLESTLFRLFTCIKVSDSVTSGVSYFYAEVRRLKALLSALETPHQQPLFFCIDEIFRGTNNRERLLGSRAYLSAVAGQAGVGLVATHDLDLVKLTEERPQIANFHFRDELVDGQMAFDYRLYPGPSPTTNALQIMRWAGLPVAEY